MSKIDDQIAEYWQTVDALAALDAKTAPMIAARDKLQAEFEPKLHAMNEKIVAANAPRYDLSMNLAFLARALGSKIAERPAAE